ncbi:MAG: 5,6-dimethylbenzimidazole synthase [Planctomycetaceae bacterium]
MTHDRACPPAESYHGGLDLEELARFGIKPEDATDFSSNILPHGPSPRVRAAIASAPLDRYPDRECRELRQAIGSRYQVDPSRILVGNGCSELIHLVASSLLEPDDQVLVVGPTFSEYSRASQLALAAVTECHAQVETQFRVPVEQVGELLESQRFKLVWICNPNNPTGQLIDCEQLAAWLANYPQVMFVVDESYIEFCESVPSLLTWQRDNLIVLRSMTKAYALAGVRLGFAAVPSKQYEKLARRRVPWSVSILAEVAGVAALKDRAYYEAALGDVRREKSLFEDQLAAHGFRPLPSATGYFLLPVNDAARVRERLLSHGLVVRDCRSFGIQDHLRIAVRDRASHERLLSVLSDQAPAPVRAIAPSETPIGPAVDQSFVDQLNELFRLRRDVRRFRREPIPARWLSRWIESACLAPSVGLSQPWRFVSVRSPEKRAAVVAEFENQNELAAQAYADDETAKKYRELKLAGLREAPEQLAVFVESNPALGRGLGRSTMPESVTYSVVAAVQNLWLAARAEGVGMGWVSILRPEVVQEILELPPSWQLVAYLCIGWPLVEADEIPELQREGWEYRVEPQRNWLER